MPRRQLTIFTIGYWVAILTALFHMVGHVSGPAPAANDTERQLLDLATDYRMLMPGGSERSLMDVLSGFSLSFAVLVGLIGGLGLIVQKRGRNDGPLMLAVSRAIAAAGVVLVVISLTHWFIIPSLMLALMTFCFLFAAVQPPVPVERGHKPD
jgi:hypothetical protein